MSYVYEKEKHGIFTEDGQRLFLAIRDQVNRMLDTSGAVQMGHAASLPDGMGAANSWDMLACVDRLVEIGELREVGEDTEWGQDRVFVRKRT